MGDPGASEGRVTWSQVRASELMDRGLCAWELRDAIALELEAVAGKCLDLLEARITCSAEAEADCDACFTCRELAQVLRAKFPAIDRRHEARECPEREELKP
jgi:hypothetical protein